MAARKTQGNSGSSSELDRLRFLEREARVARALREVASALGASLELDELLELVISRVVELVESEQAVLFLFDDLRQSLMARAPATLRDKLRLPVTEGLLGTVASTGRSARVSDLTRERKQAEWDAPLATQTRSALVTPIKNNLNRTVGALVAFNKRGGQAFTDDDEEIFSVLATHAAIAIDNSHLLVNLIRKNQQLQQAQLQLTRRVRDLELLFELERATAHAHSHEELARAVLDRLARACNAEGAALVLSDEGAQTAVQFALTRARVRPGEVTEREGAFQTRVVEVSESTLSAVLTTGQPIQMEAVDALPFAQGLPMVHSIIGEPLEGEESALGALGVVDKRGGPFTAEDLGLLRLVSANVSTAVRLFNTNRAREREDRLSSIGRLLSQVVHDLKSPLTVISGYVQLMEESEDRPTRTHHAEEILKQFQALVAMQREVLAFARGETQVFARKVLLDHFLDDLKEQLEKELAGKQVRLIVAAERLLVVHFDSERITRALQNLVRNAAEALSEHGGGQVVIRARAEGTSLILQVEDDGPGIPEVVAPQLFQSFVTSGKREGTGLGLAIVKRIVEEHGGTIALVPAPRGACFRILLPNAVLQAERPARASKKAAAPRAPAKTSGKRS